MSFSSLIDIIKKGCDGRFWYSFIKWWRRSEIEVSFYFYHFIRILNLFFKLTIKWLLTLHFIVVFFFVLFFSLTIGLTIVSFEVWLKVVLLITTPIYSGFKLLYALVECLYRRKEMDDNCLLQNPASWISTLPRYSQIWIIYFYFTSDQ